VADVDRVPCDGNIGLFVDGLHWERDPARRERLKRLLIEEEDRFVAREERLGMVERHIERGEAIIARQADLIARLKNNGADVSDAESALRKFEAIQNLFLTLHYHICEGGGCK